MSKPASKRASAVTIAGDQVEAQEGVCASLAHRFDDALVEEDRGAGGDGGVGCAVEEEQFAALVPGSSGSREGGEVGEAGVVFSGLLKDAGDPLAWAGDAGGVGVAGVAWPGCLRCGCRR